MISTANYPMFKNKLDFLSEVLEDFCTKHDLPFISADDILYSDNDNYDEPLSPYERDWLHNYIEVWDEVANA